VIFLYLLASAYNNNNAHFYGQFPLQYHSFKQWWILLQQEKMEVAVMITRTLMESSSHITSANISNTVYRPVALPVTQLNNGITVSYLCSGCGLFTRLVQNNFWL